MAGNKVYGKSAFWGFVFGLLFIFIPQTRSIFMFVQKLITGIGLDLWQAYVLSGMFFSGLIFASYMILLKEGKKFLWLLGGLLGLMVFVFWAFAASL